MIYYKKGATALAESTNFDTFYLQIMQLMRKHWDKSGNDIIGISNDKMYRIFSGKQKDFETLIKMAEFMRIGFVFRAI